MVGLDEEYINYLRQPVPRYEYQGRSYALDNKNRIFISDMHTIPMGTVKEDGESRGLYPSHPRWYVTQEAFTYGNRVA